MTTSIHAIRWKLTCLAALALGAGCGEATERVLNSKSSSAHEASVIPAPREVRAEHGSLVISSGASVTTAGGAAASQAAKYFRDLLARTHSLALAAPVETRAPGQIHFELLTGDRDQAAEGYTLKVSADRAVISAHDARGLFYGAVTLWQLAPLGGGAPLHIPALSIADAPRFRWRGLMLDSARHYQSTAFIRQLLDTMAQHKLNVLHWHLTDDQAWRLEIKKYPRLTDVGAWRIPAGPAAAADIDAATGKPRLYGGFYSQHEVRELVAYAAERHITIVPEIEMPGHASAAIVAYPHLAANATPLRAVPADWGVYPNLFNVDEQTFAFFKDVLVEVVELFPGEYIHVGGDEAVKDQWRASPKIQSRMRELGLPDEHALQSWFIQRIGKILDAHGRRLIGWDEILEGGLAPNATVMSWRGLDGAVAAAQAGHDAVLSPGPTLYFDNRPLDAPVPGRGRVVSVKDVYDFDPAPEKLNDAQRAHILGVQANVWTEHIRTEERVQYMTFPRLAALAEVAWSAQEQRNWDAFSARLPAQLQRYAASGVRYASDTSPQAPSSLRTSHELKLCSDQLVLSLEDDAPVRGERAVFLLDIMNPCWIYPGVDLTQPQQLDVVIGQVPFNFQIGEDLKKIPLHAPRTLSGELEVRLNSCDGERLASLSLTAAMHAQALTSLPRTSLPARDGRQDLCFIFTRASVDPIWAIHSIRLQPAGTS